MHELFFLFGDARDDRARDVVAFVGELPRLCRGTLVECDLAVPLGEVVTCLARFRGPPPEAVKARLLFWAWRVGGSMRSLPAGSRRRPEASEGAPAPGSGGIALQRVPPGLLRSAALSLLGRLEGVGPDLDQGRLSLRLALGTPDAAGVSFERRRMALFVPSPHALPPGEEIALQLRRPEGDALAAKGVVAAVRAAGEQGPGSPAGLVVGLVAPCDRAMDVLDAHAGSQAGEGRRAPRYTVHARAKVTLREAESSSLARLTYSSPADFAEDYVENLSQGGAFVRTQELLAPGSRVQLDLALPGGSTVSAPAVVVYGNDRGVGVRFELDEAGEAAVADALMHVTARRRRALVVDDDLLSRRMLGDALAERGFEVLAAAEGLGGLRALTEELLDLDLLVADLHMPGFGGEQLVRLVRGAGGEQDLAVVVVSGDVDGAAEQRLLKAGADAVLAKGLGGAAVARAAEEAVLRRGGPGRATARAIASSA
ncbi:MAG TPA: PilZ domain-containing protein [Anaeromyxobacteraceae bacterium]